MPAIFSFILILLQEVPDPEALNLALRCCGTLFILLILLSISLFGIKKGRRRRKVEQTDADLRAREIATATRVKQIALVDRHDLPFALYLRPFDLDKRIRARSISKSRIPHIRMMQYLLRDKVNYDYQLKQEFAALSDVNLLCFDVTDAPGAAHVKTADETWVEDFQRLAPRAQTIVIVPGVSKGIGDEITWLTQNGLLHTAFFLRPKGYPKRRWNETVSTWKEKAFLELPVYTRREMSFRLDSKGKWFEKCTWPSRLLARGSLKDLEMRRRLFANRPLDGSNDYGLAPFPDGAFSFAWPWSLQWVVFYVFWIGIVSGAFCVAFLAMALENSIGSLLTLETAVFWYPCFGGAVCSALAILGIWKGRRYGKWCAVMSLVFELLAAAALLVYTGPREIYRAFKMEPGENTATLVFFGLAPAVMILRLLHSKYVNRFFD